MKFDWKALVKTVAPVLGTALGGPLAGAATAAITKAVLGSDTATEKDIEAALATASPEILLKLKEADQAFETRMTELGIDVGEELPVNITGLYPIHDGERRFITKHGLETFWNRDWDPYDVHREAVA